MARAVPGSLRAIRSRKMAALAAGPRASSMAWNAAATSGSVGLVVGGGLVAGAVEDVLARPGPGPNGGRRRRPSSARSTPATSAMAVAMADQPMPADR